jgi:hypothetical protein
VRKLVHLGERANGGTHYSSARSGLQNIGQQCAYELNFGSSQSIPVHTSKGNRETRICICKVERMLIVHLTCTWRPVQCLQIRAQQQATWTCHETTQLHSIQAAKRTGRQLLQPEPSQVKFGVQTSPAQSWYMPNSHWITG